jgi:hypothetical protein
MESDEEREKRIENECQPFGMIAGILLCILINQEDPSGLKMAGGFLSGWILGLLFCLKAAKSRD